jgi:hypothetical protein
MFKNQGGKAKKVKIFLPSKIFNQDFQIKNYFKDFGLLSQYKKRYAVKGGFRLREKAVESPFHMARKSYNKKGEDRH